MRKIAAAALDAEEEVYEKRYVPGLAEVSMGFRPPYPVTVYQISGDDTSGIAGLLYPNGEFHPVLPSRRGQPTECYDDSEPLNRIKHGTISWDGIVSGTIENGIHLKKDIVNRRTHDPNELLGDYGVCGELWTAIGRGTMQVGRTYGKLGNKALVDDHYGNGGQR
jgi:hypothetical protein